MNNNITTLVTFKMFASTFQLFKVLDCFGHDSYVLSIIKDKDDNKCRNPRVTVSMARFLIAKYSIG